MDLAISRLRRQAEMKPRFQENEPGCSSQSARCVQGVGKRMSREARSRPTPLVSVVIPCYNYGAFLIDAVRSVSSQTLTNTELLVVDDGSTDAETISVLGGLSASGVTVLHQPNGGPSSARNRGIARASGKYVCCLDADDILHPSYLEQAVALMEAEPSVGVTYSWVRRFGDSEGVWMPEPFDITLLLHHNLMVVSAVFLREAWEVAGGFWEEMSPGFEDWEFWINLASHGYRARLIPAPLFLKRKHGRSLLDEATEKRDALVAKIRFRHSRLYENPELVHWLSRGHSREEVADPFAVLSAAEDYRAVNPDAPACLVIGEVSARTQGGIVHDLRCLLSERTSDAHIIIMDAPPSSASAHSQSQDLRLSFFEALDQLCPTHYRLAEFLPPHTWRAFVRNYFLARGIRTAFFLPIGVHAPTRSDLAWLPSHIVLRDGRTTN